MLELPIFLSCQRVTGVLGDYAYVATETGAWVVHRRCRRGGERVDAGVEPDVRLAAYKARKRIDSLGRDFRPDHALADT